MNKLTLTEMCLVSSTCSSITDSSRLLLEKGLIDHLTHISGSGDSYDSPNINRVLTYKTE